MQISQSEIRIYYECLEQALHFILPACQEAIGHDIGVTLIEISKTTSRSVVAESLASGLALRNPDGIVTLVLNGVEHPLVWIEFTTQVEAEDHTLQGFNSLVAAGSAQIPFIKVVARRTSSSDHGGNTRFDFLEPYRLLWREYQTPSIQLDWPVTLDGSRAIRHPKYGACPPTSLGLDRILGICFRGVVNGMTSSKALVDYATMGDSEIATAIKLNMQSVASFTPKLRSTRFYQRQDGRWELKFNRWGHSMDPERGMAEYLGTLLGEPLVGRLNDANASTIAEALEAMRRGTGITIPIEAVRNARVNNAETYFLSSVLNRAGIIIAWYCNEFILADGEGNPLVVLKWDLKKPQCLGVPFETSSVTKLFAKTEITEDDVTYVVANRVFPENNFEVLSVSYPGAQGDLAILTGSGRSVKRKYFDVIGVKNSSDEEKLLLLVEAKGKRQPSTIQPDVETVLAWSIEPDRRSNLLGRVKLKQNTFVSTSVAYPGQTIADISRQNELDLVVLVDGEGWKIVPQKNSKFNGVTVLAGQNLLPERYKY
jgi:hypothetical protein